MKTQREDEIENKAEFPMAIHEKYEILRREQKFKELVRAFKKLDFKNIEKESKLFRENFILGDRY